jgi:3-oxoacyl-[acyl-carrier-protein] synthase II
MPHRVVITGLGPVTSAGIGKAAFYENLWEQRVQAREIPASFRQAYAFRSLWYVPLPEVSLPEHGITLLHEHALQPEDRMVILGTKLALEDAGFRLTSQKNRMVIDGLDGPSAILGTGLSGMQTALESYLVHCVPPATLQAVFPNRRLAFNRMVVPKTMPNSPAAWASICFGLTGACTTLSASCASSTYAIGEAFRRVRDGYDPVVLTGGVESLREDFGFIMRGFDALGVLTQSPDGRPLPFGKNRSGFLFAEGGACLLVLEELEHARQRGAPIYAEILDFRANSDATNLVQMDPEAKQIIRLLAELSAGRKIDYLNTHGTGTVANDAIEARAIQTVFGDRTRQPLLNSTKGLLGHTLGASGAIEAAVTALALSRGSIHGNCTEDPLENLNLPLGRVKTPIEHALSVSYGFGGHNGALLFKRYEPGA